VDLRAVVRALAADVRGARIREGGSTVTQQLVRNLYLSGDRTIARKLKEAWLALVMERSCPRTRS
jgi:membrane peptidoglycan carboxypeptidase